MSKALILLVSSLALAACNVTVRETTHVSGRDHGVLSAVSAGKALQRVSVIPLLGEPDEAAFKRKVYARTYCHRHGFAENGVPPGKRHCHQRFIAREKSEATFKF